MVQDHGVSLSCSVPSMPEPQIPANYFPRYILNTYIPAELVLVLVLGKGRTFTLVVLLCSTIIRTNGHFWCSTFIRTFLNINSYVTFLKKLKRLVLLYGTELFRYVYGTHGTPILQGIGGIKLRRDNLIPRNNGCNHWIQRKIYLLKHT
jgi:hypothetical protein